VASAWVLLHGAGLRGPAKSLIRQDQDSTFEETFAGSFNDWLYSLEQSFGTSNYQGFRAGLDDWFSTVQEMMRGHGFLEHCETQTDGTGMPTKEEYLNQSIEEMDHESGEFAHFLGQVGMMIDVPPMKLELSKKFVGANIAPEDFDRLIAQNEAFQSSLDMIEAGAVKKGKLGKKGGRARPAPWLLGIIGEFYESRKKQMGICNLGNTSVWHCSQTTADSFAAYALSKVGIKKMIKQFEADVNASLLALKDTDPIIYMFYQFKSNEWSSYSLDFYLMCRSKLPKNGRMNNVRFLESIFSSIGKVPLNAASNAMKLYGPRGVDSLLCCMVSVVNALLAGRRDESLAIFKNRSRGGVLTFDTFTSLLNSLTKTCSVEGGKRICQLFSKNGDDYLTLDEFEVCSLYCGFFGEPSVSEAANPFMVLAAPAFEAARTAMNSGDQCCAILELLDLEAQWVDEWKIPESELYEVLKMCLKGAHVLWRNRPMDPGIGKSISYTCAPLLHGGLGSPGRGRLASWIVSRIKRIARQSNARESLDMADA
jgi:hypothetical protein